MKKFHIVLFALFMAVGASAQWVPQNSGTGAELRSVYFTDVNTGYVVGYNWDSVAVVILKTTNGGTDWIAQNSGTLFMLHQVYFPKPDTGCIVGDSGTILKTTNGGTNWLLQYSGTTKNLNSVYFTDANTGYAVGDSGTILKTTDGGSNWVSQNLGTNYNLTSVHFPVTDTGFIIGHSEIYGQYGTINIFRTNNGGVNWAQQYSDSCTGWCWGESNSIQFPDGNTGYAIGGFYGHGGGGGQYLLKTNDSGYNWIDLPYNQGTVAVCFADANTGYRIYRYGEMGYLESSISITTDGGENWIMQWSGSYVNLNSLYFPSADTGYAVGNINSPMTGIILKTTNGGLPVGINDNPLTTESLKISPNPSSSQITISTPTTPNENTFMTIYNLNGQALLSRQITEKQTVVDVAGLSQGVYFVKVSDDRTVQVGKFVKQ
jgi:photosystem II stability/assembly factor-like uncharacterized protein